jgi:hypothetical protein
VPVRRSEAAEERVWKEERPPKGPEREQPVPPWERGEEPVVLRVPLSVGRLECRPGIEPRTLFP